MNMAIDETGQKGAMLTIHRPVSRRCSRDNPMVNDHRAFLGQRVAIKHLYVCYSECFRHTYNFLFLPSMGQIFTAYQIGASYFLGRYRPRDAQRDCSKRAEKQKVDLGEEQVILCHTDGVLREWLPHLRGSGALDTRSAMAERAGNQNDRSAYEYGRPFLREYSDL